MVVYMYKNMITYCSNCDDLVEFDVKDEEIKDEYKGQKIVFRFQVGRCKKCKSEVSTDNNYNFLKAYKRIEAYEKAMGLITIDDISELLNKYDLGKESLSDIAGFGKITIKRYFEGFLPAREYSAILYNILNDEKIFMKYVEANKEKLKDVTYRKIMTRYKRLNEIGSSKIDQISNYLITHLEEVTPLALEKLLFFSNGVNYALNGSRLIDEDSQAWAHGPVYPCVYNKYKKYGYKPIDDGIYSTHGCLVSKLSEEEMKAIDLVIKTFGLYSPKTMEKISHLQIPWIEKRNGYSEEEAGNDIIDENTVKQYYIENKLNSEENIMNYILDCVKS